MGCGPFLKGTEGGEKGAWIGWGFKWIGLAMARRPFLILFLVLSTSLILTKFAISQHGLPEFDDPYLGFETRFTPLGQRLVTLENLRKEVNTLGLLENYPGERLSGREARRRRRRDAETGDDDSEAYDFVEDDEDFRGIGGYCSSLPLEDHSRIALELSSGSLFSRRRILLLCFFQKEMESLQEYQNLCELEDEDGGGCCPLWSLPNYIAEFRNRTDCMHITEEDVLSFREGLQSCREFFEDPSHFEGCDLKGSDCPKKCHRDGSLHSALFLTVDDGYQKDKEVRYTMMILPIPKSKGSKLRSARLQAKLRKIVLPERGVDLGGYDFGDKDLVFKRRLVSDLSYIGLGAIPIFILLVGFTKSVGVPLVSFLLLPLTLGVSYFLYTSVFGIHFFPFMNMLLVIILMGIGTDGTLILGAEFARLRRKHRRVNVGGSGEAEWEVIMEALLRETTAPLFLATGTSAGAFFASLTSSVTTIKCFSIFAGTSIIVGFILLYACIPPTLLLCDVCFSFFKSLLPVDNKNVTKILKALRALKKPGLTLVGRSLWSEKTKSLLSTVAWTSSFIFLTAILGWAFFQVFHSPGFRLPDSEQFQLLSTSHPIERFDREIEPNFIGGSLRSSSNNLDDIAQERLTLYLVWGVKPLDTGSGWDPHDNGVLTFNSNFSLEDPKNQKWMRKLCGKLKKQAFYDETANSVVGAEYDACFLDTMVKWMRSRECHAAFNSSQSYAPCCRESKFPWDSTTFSTCVVLAARDLYRTPALYFTPDVAGPKFFTLRENGEKGERSGGGLATFVLRIRTNITFSLNYEKMKASYDQIEEFWKNEVESKAPPELENGFFVSAHLDFFDLQNSLLFDTWRSVGISAALSFFLLLPFTKSLVIASGAVMTIIAIVIASSGILIYFWDWRLGVFESIALTVAVGLSDFTAHHALEFARRKSVTRMARPTFFSALTTLITGLAMLSFSEVLVYQQIGAFFTVLIIVSWLFSVLFLSPLLKTFDRLMNLVTCRPLSRLPTAFPPPFQRELREIAIVEETEPVVNALVFSNPMASETSCRNSAEQLDTDTISVPTSSRIHGLSRSTPNISRGNEHPSAVLEKVKLLKKVAAETSV